jgi:hypothetical protein
MLTAAVLIVAFVFAIGTTGVVRRRLVERQAAQDEAQAERWSRRIDDILERKENDRERQRELYYADRRSGFYDGRPLTEPTEAQLDGYDPATPYELSVSTSFDLEN